MRIACVSDLHGHLPNFLGLEFDALLIGGDICPSNNHSPGYQAYWLDTKFRKWLQGIDKPIIAVAGNHDLIFEHEPQEVPSGLPWTYLEDSGTTLGELKVWGSPWQKRFFDWAFNADEAQLKEAWDKIPPGTDIFLLHGPAYGMGDFSPYGKEYCGSPSLVDKIDELKPKLVIYGHIHSGYGRYERGDTIVLNASLVNEKYAPVHDIQIVEI